jgi:hypothetical protein
LSQLSLPGTGRSSFISSSRLAGDAHCFTKNETCLKAFWTGLCIVFLGSLCGVALFGYETGQDHLGSISLNKDGTWYRNYGDSVRREIQDRDIVFHDLGRTIENARKADIIFIGHSMLLWGLNWKVLRDFESKHGIRFFNLGSAGDGSGEFLLRVIKKHGLHPNMWVINADDNAANFFAVSLDDFGNFGRTAANQVMKYGRWQSIKNVYGRNLRWRFESLLRDLPEVFVRRIYRHGTGLVTYRSAVDGNWYLDGVASYVSKKTETIKLTRTSCPSTPEEILGAKRYVKEIGGSIAITQVPYHRACAERVLDIANALNAPAFVFDATEYTSSDGGGHLDAEGSEKYSRLMLAQLENTDAFRALVRKKLAESSRASARTKE